MNYRLDFDEETRLLIRHMSPDQKKRVRASLREISKDPQVAKFLQGELAGLQSYRVGHLRIVYSMTPSERIVHVIAIGPRRTVYEELERELLGSRP